MDFVRKLNLICSNTNSPSKSQKTDDSVSLSKNTKQTVNKENNNISNNRSPYKRRSNQRNSPSSLARLSRSKANNESKQHKKNNSLIYLPPQTSNCNLVLDDHLLNNGNREYLQNSSSFRLHRLNNNAFKLIYRNFKEVELINELK